MPRCFFISICNYPKAFECYKISKSVVLQYGGICSFIQIESVEVKIYLFLLSPFSNLEIACKPNLKMKRYNLLLPKIIFSQHSVLICYLNDFKTIRNEYKMWFLGWAMQLCGCLIQLSSFFFFYFGQLVIPTKMLKNTFNLNFFEFCITSIFYS